VNIQTDPLHSALLPTNDKLHPFRAAKIPPTIIAKQQAAAIPDCETVELRLGLLHTLPHPAIAATDRRDVGWLGMQRWCCDSLRVKISPQTGGRWCVSMGIPPARAGLRHTVVQERAQEPEDSERCVEWCRICKRGTQGVGSKANLGSVTAIRQGKGMRTKLTTRIETSVKVGLP
jgi:hypothetical protein